MAHFAFNANNVAPSAAFEPIPAQWYDAIITASEIKPTASGNGKRLNLTFEVIGGEYGNRKVFEGLNIENPNADTQRISLENLSGICHAIGVMNLTQTEQLHGKPLRIKVAIKAASGDYEARNVIRGYEASGGKAGGASRPGSAPAGRPAAAQQRPAAAAAAPAAAPARGPAAAAAAPARGRPAAATAPVRQAPVAAPAPEPAYEEPAYEAPADDQYNDADAAGFAEEVAPWDEEN